MSEKMTDERKELMRLIVSLNPDECAEIIRRMRLDPALKNISLRKKEGEHKERKNSIRKRQSLTGTP